MLQLKKPRQPKQPSLTPSNTIRCKLAALQGIQYTG